MATEKLTTWLKNKTWTNPQIKNNKNSIELQLIRPQTGHKNAERVFKFLNHLWRKLWIFMDLSKLINQEI